MSTKKKIFFIFFITVVALGFRFHGIPANTPFWVDEFSSVHQAQLLIKHGLSLFHNSSILFERNNILSHILIASNFNFFGLHEWVARLPFVIIGSLVPGVVFLLAESIYSIPVAIGASLLTTFSYFEITWSRQARGYVLLQLIILATLYLYNKIQRNKKNQPIQYIVFLLLIALGLLTHFMFYIFICSLGIHFLFTRRKNWKIMFRSKFTSLFFLLFCLIFFGSNMHMILLSYFKSGFIKANNLWYYHSFLWREYQLISYLGLIGLFISLVKKNSFSLLMGLYIFFHIFFISFMFAPYSSRYILPVFPLFLILASYLIVCITDSVLTIDKVIFHRTIKFYLPLMFILFIIVNGYKFTIKPKSYYSVNHDFREIANIDYHAVYKIIKEKGKPEQGMTAVIDTWTDREQWYLGFDYQPLYIFRWQNDLGYTNGIQKRTDFEYNSNHEKVLTHQSNVRLISDLIDFKKIIQKYKRGFIFIDDVTLPKDVIEYAEKNLKKELYTDHYTLDDNPYSLWPATLYSWGIEQ